MIAAKATALHVQQLVALHTIFCVSSCYIIYSFTSTPEKKLFSTQNATAGSMRSREKCRMTWMSLAGEPTSTTSWTKECVKSWLVRVKSPRISATLITVRVVFMSRFGLCISHDSTNYCDWLLLFCVQCIYAPCLMMQGESGFFMPLKFHGDGEVIQHGE